MDIDVDDEEHDELVGQDGNGQPQSERGSEAMQTEEGVPRETKTPLPHSHGIMTPAVRRLLKEHNLSAEDIQGLGKDGRICKEDIQRFLVERQQSTNTGATMQQEAAVNAMDQRVTLDPIQVSMSKVMTASLGIPHFLYTHSVDVTDLNRIRTSLDPNTKTTALPFILKAISHALNQFRRINSHYDGGHKELLLKGPHHFGVAMDTPNGLLVPVVRNVQNHEMSSLVSDLKRLGGLAREGKLSPGDLAGATFTISNIGSIGGDVVSPVIVPPQVGIVALGRVHDVLVSDTDDNGEHKGIVVKQKMTLSWSADHRVVDGATVARCAQMVQQLLEDAEWVRSVAK